MAFPDRPRRPAMVRRRFRPVRHSRTLTAEAPLLFSKPLLESHQEEADQDPEADPQKGPASSLASGLGIGRGGVPAAKGGPRTAASSSRQQHNHGRASGPRDARGEGNERSDRSAGAGAEGLPVHQGTARFGRPHSRYVFLAHCLSFEIARQAAITPTSSYSRFICAAAFPRIPGASSRYQRT